MVYCGYLIARVNHSFACSVILWNGAVGAINGATAYYYSEMCQDIISQGREETCLCCDMRTLLLTLLQIAASPIMKLLTIYTVSRKKTWQYICDHNSGKTNSIFIIFALM